MADESDDDKQMLCARLSEAIHNNNTEQVRRLIQQGVDLGKQCYSSFNHRGLSPLALTCCHGHWEIMNELLKAGADPNQASGQDPQPPMHIVADETGLTFSMMRSLISYGAEVNLRGADGMTILHYLASGRLNDSDDNLLSAAKLLLQNGASFYSRDDDFDQTPLYDACRWGNLDLVKLFIAKGADVNFDVGHNTMLRGAASGCSSDVFDLLLNIGANRVLTSNDLISPCAANDHAMLEKILDTCDVDINMELELDPGTTILHYACGTSYVNSGTVRLLLDRGANVRAVSYSGDTALHYAANHCNCNAIRQLLAYNPPININNNREQTVLDKLIHYLIKNYSGLNPCDISKWWRTRVLAFNMLATAGAKVTARVENELNQFHTKHPETNIVDYEISPSTSLKEACRFVIRGMVPVPVDTSVCKLPIPRLLQEYLNFPEFEPLVDEYLNKIGANWQFT